jgi:hypothetical protein
VSIVWLDFTVHDGFMFGLSCCFTTAASPTEILPVQNMAAVLLLIISQREPVAHW